VNGSDNGSRASSPTRSLRRGGSRTTEDTMTLLVLVRPSLRMPRDAVRVR
jgi:hypothetical protein